MGKFYEGPIGFEEYAMKVKRRGELARHLRGTELKVVF